MSHFSVLKNKRKLLQSLILFLAVGLFCQPLLAATMQNEIDHLLEFVKNTDCQYERNGDLHSGPEAVAHIRKKYNYFKDDIDSSEKFIELSASKSTMSGKFYMIHCADQPSIKSQQWLLQELHRYRAGQGG
ncbi:MAG: DUF5329 domain-containing protein [gamma proteobacterium symbiont of Bathyaustriella thionipta]|nr:DUF5329 domain-containing protein [gamma proteobacterium symbiont of Bathyaustriella thionipta]